MTDTQQSIDTLVQQAVNLQREQRLDEAEQCLLEALQQDPMHPFALQFMSGRSFQRNDYESALKYLHNYLAWDPVNLNAMHAVCSIYETLGRFDDAVRLYRQALAISPNDPKTLLFLGGVLAMRQEEVAAAAAGSLLETSAPEMLQHDRTGMWDAMVQKRSKTVREALQSFRDKTRQDAVASVPHDERADFSRVMASRWRPVFDEHDDDQRRPSFFHVPDLGHTPWFEATRFAWAEELENAAPEILKEVSAVLNLDTDGVPYIEEGLEKSDTWRSLAGKRVWSALHFWDDALPNAQTLKRFPVTRAALEKLPLVELGGTPIEAFLSTLKPHTIIPPHFGIANYRLTVHLPLIVPDGCGVEVAGEKRETQFGKLMAFDDSFDHQAWNNSDTVRVVLIFEVWHPDLSTVECDALSHMLERYENFSRNRRALISGGMSKDGSTDVISPLVQKVTDEPEPAQNWLNLIDALQAADRGREAAHAASLASERSSDWTDLIRKDNVTKQGLRAKAAEQLVHNTIQSLHDIAVGADHRKALGHWQQTADGAASLNDAQTRALERSDIVRRRWRDARRLPPLETTIDRSGKPVGLLP